MSSYDETMYHPSPASSSELIESAAGTPHTSLSAFSPEDARIMKSSTVHLGVTSSRSSQQDPFVSTGTQPRGGLSAKATAFEPSADIRTASATTSAFTMDTSQKTQIPNASDCLENFAVSRSPNRAPHQTNATHFGTFTTDSHSTRVIKVTGKNPVATFLPFIEASKKVGILPSSHLSLFLSIYHYSQQCSDSCCRSSVTVGWEREDQRGPKRWATLIFFVWPISRIPQNSTLGSKWTTPGWLLTSSLLSHLARSVSLLKLTPPTI
jgi:hypothetical protein